MSPVKPHISDLWLWVAHLILFRQAGCLYAASLMDISHVISDSDCYASCCGVLQI